MRRSGCCRHWHQISTSRPPGFHKILLIFFHRFSCPDAGISNQAKKNTNSFHLSWNKAIINLCLDSSQEFQFTRHSIQFKSKSHISFLQIKTKFTILTCYKWTSFHLIIYRNFKYTTELPILVYICRFMNFSSMIAGNTATKLVQYHNI